MKIIKFLKYLTVTLTVLIFTGCTENEPEKFFSLNAQLNITDISYTSATFELIMDQQTYELGSWDGYLIRVYLNGERTDLYQYYDNYRAHYSKKVLTDGRVSLSWRETSLVPQTQYDVVCEYFGTDTEIAFCNTYKPIISISSSFTTSLKDSGELNISDITPISASFELLITKETYDLIGTDKAIKVNLNEKSYSYNKNNLAIKDLADGRIAISWQYTDLIPETEYNVTVECLTSSNGAGIASASGSFTTAPKEAGQLNISDITPFSASFELLLTKETYNLMGADKDIKVNLNDKSYSYNRYTFDWSSGSLEYMLDIKDLEDGRIVISWECKDLMPETEYKVTVECLTASNGTGIASASGSFTTLPIGEWLDETFTLWVPSVTRNYPFISCSLPDAHPYLFGMGLTYKLHLTSTKDPEVKYIFTGSNPTYNVSDLKFTSDADLKNGTYTYYMEGPFKVRSNNYIMLETTKMHPSKSSSAYITISM